GSRRRKLWSAAVGKARDRLPLAAAMALANKRKATLAGDEARPLEPQRRIQAALMDSKGFDFTIANMPGANRLTLYVLAAAEHERHMIGERTRPALAGARN